MEFDLSKIRLSDCDMKRGLVLPKAPSQELAEFVGILTGDGHISFNTKENVVCISGDSRLDYDHMKYIKSLIKNLFNLNVKISKRRDQNLARIKFCSKGLLNFFQGMGYYKHLSRNIKIPDWIICNKVYFLNFLKGLADTDFSLMLYKNRKIYPPYPVIALTSADRGLILLISRFLEEQGFNTDMMLDTKRFDKRSEATRIENRLRLSGRQNLELWMNVIGFRNKRHLDKYREGIESQKITRSIGRPQLEIHGLKNKNGDGGI